MPPPPPESFAFVGDVHGHLQLALCTIARVQRERGRPFDAIFLCGDVGTFTQDTQVDEATRRHARKNPCELEFLTQWAATPQAPWLDAIFQPEPEGLGLTCPVIMVHGNHEGFAHIETLYHRRRTPDPLPLHALPPIDTDGHIQFLPPGWIVLTPAGYRIAGLGGIEPGQRRAKYDSMAYLDETAVQRLAGGPPIDILITHQGPAAVQGDHGSPTLDMLLESVRPRFWFHGHSTPVNTPVTVGNTQVIPLGDVAFTHGKPGLHGWATLDLAGQTATLDLAAPPFLSDAHQRLWHSTPTGLLIHPDLVPFAH